MGGIAVVAILVVAGVMFIPNVPISISYRSTETLTSSATVEPSATMDFAVAGTALVEMTQTVKQATSDAQIATIYLKQTQQKEFSNAGQTQIAAHFATIEAQNTTNSAPTLEPTITKTPMQSGLMLFGEDFEDGNAEFFKPDRGKWDINIDEDGNTVYEVDYPTGSSFPNAYFENDPGGNHIVEFRIKFLGFTRDSLGGISFRESSSGDYQLTLNPYWNNIALASWDKSNWRRLADKNISIDLEKWYFVRLEVRDTEFLVYLDGALVIEATNSQFSTGRLSLYIGPGTWAQFDDIYLASLGD